MLQTDAPSDRPTGNFTICHYPQFHRRLGRRVSLPVSASQVPSCLCSALRHHSLPACISWSCPCGGRRRQGFSQLFPPGNRGGGGSSVPLSPLLEYGRCRFFGFRRSSARFISLTVASMYLRVSIPFPSPMLCTAPRPTPFFRSVRVSPRLDVVFSISRLFVHTNAHMIPALPSSLPHVTRRCVHRYARVSHDGPFPGGELPSTGATVQTAAGRAWAARRACAGRLCTRPPFVKRPYARVR